MDTEFSLRHFVGAVAKNSIIGLVTGSVLLGCGSAWVHKADLKSEMPSDLAPEVQKKFEIKETASVPPASKKKRSHRKKEKKGEAKPTPAPTSTTLLTPVNYPSRRPDKDPLQVGEKLIYRATYLGIPGGELTLELLPEKFMDGRKVYHIHATAKTIGIFRLAYRADDTVESFFDYEGLFSHRFHLLLDETKQKRDSLELYDYEKKETYYWNRWNHRDKGYSETKKNAPVPTFSQDMLSILYYLRSQPLKDGDEMILPVVSEGNTWEAVGTVAKRETIRTIFGRVPTVVIEPGIKTDGKVKRYGNGYLWVTDDDRRIPLRMEAKMKIGYVVLRLIGIERKD